MSQVKEKKYPASIPAPRIHTYTFLFKIIVLHLNEQDLPLLEDLIIKKELKGTRSATLEVYKK